MHWATYNLSSLPSSLCPNRNLIMPASFPHKDGWVKILPPDEFSFDNPANGQRNRLVRVDRDDPCFVEGM